MVHCKPVHCKQISLWEHSCKSCILAGSVDYATEVDREDIDSVSSWCKYLHPSGCEEVFYQMCTQIIEENERHRTRELHDALDLFQWLTEQIAEV